MTNFYQFLLYAHIAVGFISLVIFWIPVVAKKGSRLHVRTGHWYAKAMYGVGITAVVLACLMYFFPVETRLSRETVTPEQQARAIAQVRDIAAFLFSIAVLTIVSVRTGLQTIQTKRDHLQLRSPLNLMLNALLVTAGVSLFFRAQGGSPLYVLFYIFAGLCVSSGIGNFRYIYKASVTRTDRIVEHLSGMIGAGIGAHTAFLLFGASRLIKELLVGYWTLVPWILPGLVGFMIILWQTRKVRSTSRPKVSPSSTPKSETGGQIAASDTVHSTAS
jgi:hypothetical protein